MDDPARRRPVAALLLLLALYLAAALSTHFAWQNRGLYPMNGDEPHYLVMADGIIRLRTLEQTEPYRQEF